MRSSGSIGSSRRTCLLTGRGANPRNRNGRPTIGRPFWFRRSRRGADSRDDPEAGLPAPRRLQHEAGAGERSQEHERPEGPRLDDVLHRGSFFRRWFGNGRCSRPATYEVPRGRSHGPSVPVRYGSSGTGCPDAPPAVPAATAGRKGGGQVLPVRRSSRRIPSTIVTTRPIPMSTSPMLKTFAIGRAAGIAKMSVNGASAGSARSALFEKPVSVPRPAVRNATTVVGITPPLT